MSEGKIVLVHAQVYDMFGYESGVAVSSNEHTKAFTALDKYLVVRYLEAIGLASEEAMNLNLTPGQQWKDLTLKPLDPDNDKDGIADGWELYVMFGPNGVGSCALAEAKISPWNFNDARLASPDGDGLTLLDEYDGGHLPTDPWNLDTDNDGVIDYYAYQYCLKGDDAGKDADGDGLSNYAEYLISEVFGYAKLDPRNPKTDGYCIDYFRKMGDLYVGEIFTDHDQVNDIWESAYPGSANRYAYDPSRDDDGDGWSNWAEAKAGTDPETEADVGIDGYVLAAYPEPCIETFLTCSGVADAAAPVVIKAWSQKIDPNMTGKADAVWHLGNSEEQASVGVNTSQKYVGLKPNGMRTFNLGPGAIQHGSVRIAFKDLSYCVAKLDQYGEIENLSIGDPDYAKWYYMAQDREGVLYTIGGVIAGEQAVGTVDYKTGKVTVNFDAERMNGMMLGDTESVAEGEGGEAKQEEKDDSTYDLLNLEQSYVIVTWSSCTTLGSFNQTLYLSDAGSSVSSLSGGYVREGLNTFVAFVDSDGNGEYTPGEPFGVARDVDVGWDGAKLRIDLTTMSAITPRVDIWTGISDRASNFDKETYGEYDSRNLASDSGTFSGLNLELTLPEKDSVRVRVVRYAVDGFFTYSCGVTNRVVLDRDFTRGVDDSFSEADFLSSDEFDIDWQYLKSEVASPLAGYHYEVTNMSYLVVLGDGPVGFTRKNQTNASDRVTALLASEGESSGSSSGASDDSDAAKPLLVTRRFERNWSKPKAIGLREGAVLHGSRPTFVWSMPDEEAYAKRFGSSYTAFRIQVVNTSLNKLVWTSDVMRAPAQDRSGNFVWTAPIYAGDQTSLGQVFAKAGNYQWRVAMYNAKFKPNAKITGDVWSDPSSFSTSVDTQQETGDNGYSSIDVAVKYTGPEAVLGQCENLAEIKGKVRLQAFTSPDFSGDPAAQGFVTNKLALTDATDIRANGRLIGLKSGTYYIRAYIDSNGNFKKDPWESWGDVKEPVTVKLNQLAPIVGLYIEDADTDSDWVPDAYEYQYPDKYEIGRSDASVDPEGRIILKKTVYDGILEGKAGISRFLSGATLTLFENFEAAGLLLGIGGDTDTSTIDAIRRAVEKNIEPNSVKITSLVVDAGNGTNGKVILTVGAKATDSIAGYLFSPIYELPTSTTVEIKVYRKENLATANWGDPVKTETVTIDGSTMTERIEVPLAGVDFNSGFYKVEIVQ